TVFVAGMSTMSGVLAVPETSIRLRPWDVDVQLANTGPIPSASLTDLVKGIPGVSDVEVWTGLPTGIAQPGQVSVTHTYPDQLHGSMGISVIPPDSRLMKPPRLLEGRWLNAGETGAVVISQSVRVNALPDVQTGDTIQLSIGGRPTRWQVVGIFEFTFGTAGIFMTTEGFTAALGTNTPNNLLRVVTDNHDEETRTAVANAAERVLTEAGIGVRSSASVSRFEAAGTGHMLPIVMIFLALAVALGVVGCIGL